MDKYFYNKQRQKIYQRHCNYCGKYYEGRGRYFCGYDCFWKSLQGRKLSKKTKIKIGRFNQGKKLSKETKLKIGRGLRKGPKYKFGNRWFIWKPCHPFAWKYGGYVAQSRFIAEKCLGRYLTRKEIVHHINKNTLDNRPDNLYIFPSFKEHTFFHLHLKNKPQLKSNLITSSNG